MGTDTSAVLRNLQDKRAEERNAANALGVEIDNLDRRRQAHMAAATAYENAIDQVKAVAPASNGAAPHRQRTPAGAVEAGIRQLLQAGAKNADDLVGLLNLFKPETVRATVRKLVKSKAIVDAGGILNLAPSA